MSTSHPLPPKKEVALALLERSSVHVHLDPRGDGVMVPVWFKKQPQLVLQIGLNMPVPIPDLRLDDEGLSCTLSFNRSPFYCVVPWPSVFAMVGDDGRGMVWPDDVPPEIATQAQGQAQAQTQAKPEPAVKRPAPKRVPAAELARASDAGGAAVSDEKPTKAKKPRTKKPRVAAVEPEPDLRPMLVAVPAPAENRAEKRGPRVLADKKRAPAPSPHRPPQRPTPSASSSSSPPKPKRELPPYLRVVK
jgi:stringent starvation protein B